MVFSAFTTRAPGRARWICSPSESVFETNSGGGNPLAWSRGLEMSRTTLPVRSPAAVSAGSEPSPPVALTIRSASFAASANVDSGISPWSAYQAAKSSRAAVAAGSRVPMATAWPTSDVRAATARPTALVPRTAMRIPPSYPGRLPQREDEAGRGRVGEQAPLLVGQLRLRQRRTPALREHRTGAGEQPGGHRDGPQELRREIHR